MGNRFRVVLSNRTFYKEIEVSSDTSSFSIGTYVDCDIRFHKELFFEEFRIRFEKDQSNWNLFATDNLYFDSGSIKKMLNVVLKHGDSIVVCYQNSGAELFCVDVSIDFNIGFAKYERIIDLSSSSTFKIGAMSDCQIKIQSSFIKDDLIVFERTEKGYKYSIHKSTYGLFLNGTKAENKGYISNRDFFSISDFNFYYADRKLWTEIKKGMWVNSLSYRDSVLPAYYPKFQRNTRIQTTINEDEIEVLEPPAVPKKTKERLITSLMPSFGMLMSSGFMAMAGGTNMIVFSAITGGMAVATTVVNLIQNKSDYKKQLSERIEKYTKYSEKKSLEISEFRNEELKQLEQIYLDTKKEQYLLANFSDDLFDRNPDNEDFLKVRLGTGCVPSLREIKYKKQEKLEIEDDLQLIPQQLAEKYQSIDGAPVICSYKECNSIGVVGDENSRYQIMKNMIFDICLRHYFSDVKLFIICEGNHKSKIEWLRFLPHLTNSVTGIKNIAVDDDSRNIVFDYLYKELTNRSNEKNSNTDEKIDRESLVVIFYDEYGIQNHPLSKFIDKSKDLDVTFLFMNITKGNIPLGCDSIIFVESDTNGRIVDTKSGTTTKFQFDPIDDHTAEKMVEQLAPIYTEEISLESALTKSISLFEMLKIFGSDDLDLTSRWNSTKVFKSMAAPIGVTKSGYVYLDLHDKAHGPHGLVAGTTGSGKSELLQTYILSVATLYHPYEIAFVIIDFKGGGMVNQFKNLPHLLGAITNIDGKEIDRSLKSIRAELQKRQRLFAEAGVNHIDKYIKKYKAGEVSTPIPHLVLIVDEFAELRAEQPDFMKELISASRIGRSLGVHLILATQKPSGQVDDQIWSNSKFKLCLKVQSQEDSNEVLRSPLAAEIKEPGRAYFQVGNNEIFELFQSAYSGAPEKEANSNKKEFTIYGINESGKRIPIYVQTKDKQSEGGISQLDSIVNYVSAYCNDRQIQRLPNICLPPLSKKIDYPNNVENSNSMINIGVFDDPDNQVQGYALLDINNKNTFIVGSSQYGKTNLLQCLIRAISSAYTPKQANIYILDFASMVLKNFEDLSHVGGVVCSTEDEKLKNLFKLLYSEISERKEKLVNVGVSSYSSYLEAGYDDIPHIYLFVDNLNALMELYLQDEDNLLNVIREGISVGITVIVTCSQTAGISYKYLSNFANKIGLYCNDNNEYVTVFEHTSIVPDEVPGRCVLEIDKRLLECQTYLAFDGEKEIDRVTKIRDYIATINSGYKGIKAKIIPSIPKILTADAIQEDFNASVDEYSLPIGLTYSDVTPFYLNLAQLSILGLCGKANTGHRNFIDYIIRCLEKNQQTATSKVVILDDFSRKFEHLKDKDIVETYTLDLDTVIEKIKEWHGVLNERYNSLIETGTLGKNNDLLLLIIQNNDIAKKINDDWDTLEKFKEIVTRFKGMNVAIIFSNYQNAVVSYDAPEPLRMIKQDQHLIFFEDLPNLKPFDVPYEELKANKKKLEMGDGYYILDGSVTKLKLVKSL